MASNRATVAIVKGASVGGGGADGAVVVVPRVRKAASTARAATMQTPTVPMIRTAVRKPARKPVRLPTTMANRAVVAGVAVAGVAVAAMARLATRQPTPQPM